MSTPRKRKPRKPEAALYVTRQKFNFYLDEFTAYFVREGLVAGRGMDQEPPEEAFEFDEDGEEQYDAELAAWGLRRKLWDKLIRRADKACRKLGADAHAKEVQNEREKKSRQKRDSRAEPKQLAAGHPPDGGAK